MVNEIPVKQRIINAALSEIRAKGYSATTVDDLCEKAGVTKGAFFHHFKSKEDLAVNAAGFWSSMTGEFFAQAPYHRHTDPLARVLGYVDFRKAIIQGTVPEFTCLVGTMVQETYDSNPAIREACYQSIFGHAGVLAKDIELAKKLYAPRAKWTSKSLALHTQAVMQGAFILSKASQDPKIAVESIDHLHRYIEILLNPSSGKRRTS